MSIDDLDIRTRTRVKFLLDLGMWAAAAALAFPLRMPTDWMDAGSETRLIVWVVVSLPVQAALIAGFRLHRQSWRQVSVRDLEALLKAIGIGTALFFVAGLILHGLTGFPRTVALIEGVVAVLFMGGARLGARLWHERGRRADAEESRGERRILLVGAGSAGARMAREIRRHPDAAMTIVGFVDDDARKRHMTISGHRILGGIDDLPRVVEERGVDEVLIAMPSAPGRRTRHVVGLAREAGVGCRILPGVTEILEGDVDLARIRDVQVEDLLRREPIVLDLSGSADYVGGRVVLVTGAGGSIGSELVRQVARLSPKRVVLFGQGENSLHAIWQELTLATPGLDHVTVVGSVRDRRKVEDVMATYAPDVVFHAAAHKHVPLMEANPDEAILNNVGGTRNVTEAALAAGVVRIVNVSSDKAVRPSSVMGATKHVAEQVVQALAARAADGQALVSVRFGNVLGSRGSVVPIFQEQIRRGGPLTLTHPDMTRYFMTIPEASRLVIQAAALGQNGGLYVLDMGTPVRIRDLAEDMIRLSGADPADVEIVYTGLRPGEKLEEELFTAAEHASATRYEQIFAAHPGPPPHEDFLGGVDDLLGAADARDWDAIRRYLEALVPGFTLPAVDGSFTRNDRATG